MAKKEKEPEITLKEYLLKMPNQSQNICVGESSGWFYIGTAKYLLENHDRLRKEMEQVATDDIAEGRKELEWALSTAPDPSGHKDVASLITATNSFMKRMSGSSTRLKMAISVNARLHKHGNVMDRVVKETYKQLDGRGLCIILKGNLVGKYWFLDEFLEEHPCGNVVPRNLLYAMFRKGEGGNICQKELMK